MVPHYLVVLEQISDIVIVDASSPSRVVVLKLTVPFDRAHSFKAARKRKVDRYEKIALDIQKKGFNMPNCPLEVGCKGVKYATSRATIASMGKIKDVEQFSCTLDKIALVPLGSHPLWGSRKSQTVVHGNFISP